MRSAKLFGWLVACATVLLVMVVAVSPALAGGQDFNYQETLEHTVTGTVPAAPVVPQVATGVPLATYGYFAPAAYQLNTLAILPQAPARRIKTVTVERGPTLGDRIRARRAAKVQVAVAVAPASPAYVPNECLGLEAKE